MSLKLTLDQARLRQEAYLGIKGIPNGWWPLSGGNDCLAFQLERLGVRTRTDLAPHFISISAFRTWAGWHEVTMAELQPGDLVLENWSDPVGTEAEHIEYVHAIDRAAGTITTISANTGPVPGKPLPRGVWKKTRPLDNHFLSGIRPPYAGEELSAPYGAKQPTGLTAKQVRIAAAWLNKPGTIKGYLQKSSAEEDGKPGDIYWTEVQTWGRENGLYGGTYRLDGIPGPRTRQVEAIVYLRAKAGHKA